MKTFFFNVKYTFKIMIREKSSIFWTLIFPLLLATFMYASFGNLFEIDECFEAIDVAVVRTKNDDTLMTVLEALSSGDDSEKLINIHLKKESTALKCLENEEVSGIIYTKDASLHVAENDMNAAILESILTSYKQQENVISNITNKYPQKLPEALAVLRNGLKDDFYNEISTTDGNQDIYTNYFYAIFAFSCLFASLSSLNISSRMLPGASNIGIRKNLISTKHHIIILSEYVTLLIIQSIIEIISLFYIRLLGVDLGHKYPAMMLTLIVGCMIGLSIGVIVSAIPHINEKAKEGICSAICMLFSVLADLCASGIKDYIEHNAPILNRINPAALITDCFYSLNVFDNYERFFRNIGIMSVEALCLIFISFLLVRRKKYASL